MLYPQSNPFRQTIDLKGVFTRDRRPKLAAHRLREMWSSQ